MNGEVGLIGLGVMGAAMAKNIARAGLRLTVFNRSPGPARAFEGTGVRVAGSAGEVFARCDTIVLMLKDDAATDAVLAREGDAVGLAVKGRTLINAATLTPAYSGGLAEAVAAAGGVYIEAPVSGSRAPAEAGALLVMAAGPKAAVAAAAPIFAAIGKETIYCGAPPAAMRMKCASNFQLAGVMSGLAEAFNFARRTGLDPELFAKVVLGGPMACDFLRMKLARALAEDYAPQASVANVAYSLDVALDEASRRGVAAPLARLMRASCERAARMGLAEEDILALIKVLASAGEGEGRR